MDFEKSSYIFHPSLNKISSNTCLPVYPPAGEQAGSLPVTISIPTLDRSWQAAGCLFVQLTQPRPGIFFYFSVFGGVSMQIMPGVKL